MGLFFLVKLLNAGKIEGVPASWYDIEKIFLPQKSPVELAERYGNLKNSWPLAVVTLLSVHSKLRKPATLKIKKHVFKTICRDVYVGYRLRKLCIPT